jgi:hypothetical protein
MVYMKKINIRKYSYILYVGALSGGMALGFQNFTPKIEKETLGERTQSVTEDALSAALQTASQDHANQQMAANVDPDQIEKAHRKDRKPQTVVIPSDMIIEQPEDLDTSANALKGDDVL